MVSVWSTHSGHRQPSGLAHLLVFPSSEGTGWGLTQETSGGWSRKAQRPGSREGCSASPRCCLKLTPRQRVP